MNTDLHLERAEELTPAAPLETRESHERAMRIIAKSLVRHLLAQGYEVSVLIFLVTELIGLVTGEIQRTARRLTPMDEAKPLASRDLALADARGARPSGRSGY